MCKFKQLTTSAINSDIKTLRYIPLIKKCYRKYKKFLQDDFLKFSNNEDFSSFVFKLAPNFWIITNQTDEFMGFVYLDNFIGNKDYLYSAELTTCFEEKAWGNFTKYCAKFFLKKCFDEYGLAKIKIQIYPENFRIKQLLKSSGFIYESTLKNETLRGGKPQDIDIYALYRDYYYKTR